MAITEKLCKCNSGKVAYLWSKFENKEICQECYDSDPKKHDGELDIEVARMQAKETGRNVLYHTESDDTMTNFAEYYVTPDGQVVMNSKCISKNHNN